MNVDEETVTSTVVGNLDAEPDSYQETDAYLTWRKHTRDLYQHLFHIDLIWESTPVQFMPYLTQKDDLTTQTILSGTRTGGQEQNYVQLFSITLPSNPTTLINSTNFCDITEEIGGYGMAPSLCGLKIERRILHDGDVLAARYMPSNPLLLSTTSSNGMAYIFDWSRVSLQRFPNDPARPRAPLPPNAITEDANEEEKSEYYRRMKALQVEIQKQDDWDRRRGPAQHVLMLTGGVGLSETIEWNTTTEGILASGSKGRVCAWQIGNLSKQDERVVDPIRTFYTSDEETRVTNVSFAWSQPNTLASSTESGIVSLHDLRSPAESIALFSLSAEASSVELSPLDSYSLLAGDSNGSVYFLDLRQNSFPILTETLHNDEVTSLRWCPHSPKLFASSGKDGKVCIYNKATQKLKFKHAGHVSPVTDMGWNWQETYAGQMVSVDSNSIILWRPRDHFFSH